jgi:hypothetical protein
MQLKLNNSQIQYIFYHLNHHFEFTNEIKSRIVFDHASDEVQDQIVFPLSAENLGKFKYINDIPILFPLNNGNTYYIFDSDNNLVFNDDLLKSAFYLLSGYQETEGNLIDMHGRFAYQYSIQKKMNLPYYPLVNHYFEIIIDGIKEFCEKNNIEFRKKNFWHDQKFGFLLTHDVDRVDKYTIRNLKYLIKQLIGIADSKNSRIVLIKLLFKHIINMFTGENPFWNFEWMRSVARKYGFNSVWFFLPKGDPSIDAFFSFEEERIQKVVNKLAEEGDEIGLHATYQSIDNEKILSRDLDAVKKLIKKKPVVNRQHWLRFKYPETLRILESLGIKSDSSWSFNDHIGFRNSYCLPFRPYDIDNDRIMNIWEFPLSVMDVTLFKYQNLNSKSFMSEIEKILDAIIKFNGLFTLLWHNNNFDEDTDPGITQLYQDLLKRISELDPECILPHNFIREREAE